MNIRMSSNKHPEWQNEDLEEFRRRGITPDQSAKQIELLRNPPAAVNLDRPCKVDDGILRLSPAEQASYEDLGEQAISSGRVSKFVPASGAATRMFKDLLGGGGSDGNGNRAISEFCANLRSFAFYSRLEPLLKEGFDPVEALLQPQGLNYAALPKALIEFHNYPSGSRTAFEEHLRESAVLTRDRAGMCRIHFTVSQEHQEAFEHLLTHLRKPLEESLSSTLDVSFSSQDPSTDTLAIDAEGNPFRDPGGRLVFRPGGHGSLLRNLNELEADLILIRNIDNISHERLWPESLRWRKILTGVLVWLVTEIHGWLQEIDTGFVPEKEAKDLALQKLGITIERDRDLHRELNRPVRVCGVVKNTGEPGGGPFWVKRRQRIDRQIVESAQIDLSDPRQSQIFSAATHFNPVDMACSLRDFRGRPFDLKPYVDENAVFVSRKSMAGKPLLALERPGLWNGSMANWITLFVEIPLETFHPVKTVHDLLREPHQPVRGGS